MNNANILVWTKYLVREEWLAWRRKGIGGSDAAAVCGKHKWKSAMEVYLDKLGEVPDMKQTDAIELGLKLKDFIADEFTERTEIRTFRRNAIFQHRQYDFMLANIDRWLIGHDCGLLCKTANEFMKEQWEDGKIPETYRLQCLHYMAVTGAKCWYVAVLVGGNKFEIIKVERDELAIEELIEAERRFWHDHVLAKKPPAFDGTEASGKLLDRMYPTAAQTNSAALLPAESKYWISQYKNAAQEERFVLEKKLQAEHQLKGMLGDNETASVENHVVEWKNVYSKSGEKKTYRRFRVR